MEKSETVNNVKDFLCVELTLQKSDIDMEASINLDLGVDGDDARELLHKYESMFNVDLSDFVFEEYFGPEASFNPFSWLLNLLPGKVKQNKFKKLLVKDFVEGAIRGKL